jgi:hypothetical protein
MSSLCNAQRHNGRLAQALIDLHHAVQRLAASGCMVAECRADRDGPQMILEHPPRRPLPGAELVGQHSSALYGGAPAETWATELAGVRVVWEVRRD